MQKRILTFRDRVLAKTWYNEKFGRWEISSYGLKYAVDKGMIAGARVRHDKRAMLFQLKGDARTFFADLLAFDAEYLSYGGFSALYMKMLGSGVQAPIVYTPVPLRELDPIRVFLYPFGLLIHKIGDFFKGFVDNPLTLSFFQFCSDTIALTLGKAIFPLLEKLPNHTQLFIGLQAPENVGIRTRTRRKTPYLMALKGIIDNRLEEEFGQADGNTAWWLVLPFRWFLMWIPFMYAGKLLGKVFGHIFGPGEDMNDVEWKQKKGVCMPFLISFTEFSCVIFSKDYSKYMFSLYYLKIYF
ncbi:hypothetical protein KP509_1Z322300 [Ceratopteris richardii]|nr:hypothetical protein KP509_1Z322300 [Ceratopteris richardii]